MGGHSCYVFLTFKYVDYNKNVGNENSILSRLVCHYKSGTDSQIQHSRKIL